MTRCGVAGLALLAAVAATGCRAADLERLPTSDGVACESPDAAAFGNVWLGHFTGGYSRYDGPGHAIALDWRDETLCFPSRRSCDRHVKALRRDFHRPEGYFTCLPIR